jgi:hypothetical protein
MHRYRITVEAIDPKDDQKSLQFEVENHDDILAIAGRVPVRFGLSEDATRSLVIGFKLFSEIVLKKRAETPFAEVRPALRDFSQALKQQS